MSFSETLGGPSSGTTRVLFTPPTPSGALRGLLGSSSQRWPSRTSLYTYRPAGRCTGNVRQYPGSMDVAAIPGDCQSFQLPRICTPDAAWSCSENVIPEGDSCGETFCLAARLCRSAKARATACPGLTAPAT